MAVEKSKHISNVMLELHYINQSSVFSTVIGTALFPHFQLPTVYKWTSIVYDIFKSYEIFPSYIRSLDFIKLQLRQILN